MRPLSKFLYIWIQTFVEKHNMILMTWTKGKQTWSDRALNERINHKIKLPLRFLPVCTSQHRSGDLLWIKPKNYGSMLSNTSCCQSITGDVNRPPFVFDSLLQFKTVHTVNSHSEAQCQDACLWRATPKQNAGELSHVLHFVPFCRDER